MRFRVAQLFLLAGAVVLAQSPSAPPPELKVEPMAGGSILFVKNPSAQPLVTYLIELVDYPGSSFSLWSDEAIAPGSEKRIPITNMTVGAVPDYVKVRAALYADGSTAGLPDKIALLVGRRKAQAEIAKELVKRVEAGGDWSAWMESLKPDGKAKYDNAAWVNRTGQHAFVAHFKQSLTPGVDVLAAAKAAERQLAESAHMK